MAEIILPPEEEEETPQAPELNIDKPSGNSKVITIEFEAKKTNKVSTKDTNRQLYTTDTDAWFEFKETSLEGANGTYSVVFRNRHDGSIFQRTGDVVNGVAYYKIPHQEIRHAGAWRGQLVYTLENGNTTAREFGYDVKGHILDGKDVREIVVEDFETLMSQLNSMKDNAELELADLVNTAERNELERQQFYESLVEDINDLQENYQELLDTGVLQTNINEKLEELEEEYAPKLTEVTAQLAHTQNQFNDAVSKVTEDSEVILARNGHATLGERLDNMVTKGTFESNADVQLTNLIVNGDFSEGTKSWLQGGYYASFEVIDGVAKTTNFEFNNRSFIQDVSDRVVTGNIYYATLRTKVEHVEKNRYFSILSGLTGSGNYMLENCTNLTDKFDRYSGYGQWGSGGHFRVIYTFEEQGEFPAYLDDVLLIDLTKTFGAGNEPTKEEMDVLIDIIGWFDGKITLTQKQQLIWTLNLIRKNRNAITALGGGIV